MKLLSFFWQIYQRSPPGLRRVIAKLTSLAAPVFGLFVKSVKGRGFRMCVSFSDQAAFRYLQYGTNYESDLVDGVLAAVSSNRPVVFFDIGASYGFYSLAVAAIGASTGVKRVFAYEPDRRCVDALQRSAKINGFEDLLVIQQVLIGDFCGTAQMFQSLQASTSNRSFKTETEGHFRSTGTQSVRATTLDEEIKNHAIQVAEETLVFKVDVEGNEYRVLQGMAQTLSSAKRVYLLLEFYPLGIREVGSNVAALVDSLRLTDWDVCRLRQDHRWQTFEDASALYTALNEIYARQCLNPSYAADLVLGRNVTVGEASL